METAQVCLAIRPSLEQRQGCALSPGEGAELHSAACEVHLLERKCSGSSVQLRMVPAVKATFQSFHELCLNHSQIKAIPSYLTRLILLDHTANLTLG